MSTKVASTSSQTSTPAGTSVDGPVRLAELEQELAELRQRYALFFSATAHELRTPLQSIRGFVELLEPGLPPKKMTHYLSLIRHDTSRLVAVVDDLSLMSELENGTLVLNPRTLGIEPLLRELAQAFEADCPDCAMILEHAPDSLPVINADGTYLRRVLWSLLHNAGHSSPKVRRSICLSIQPRWEAHSKGWLEFSVQDDGPRIPARYREAIFEPWAGRSKGPKHLRFGRGLGLYVARHIARRMGGDLWLGSSVREVAGVRRQKPRGNVFVVRMPIAVREMDK